METDVIGHDATPDLASLALSDLESGPVTPARLAEVQRRVSAHQHNMRVRNYLIERASAAGWSDEEIRQALAEGGQISVHQVARLRKGESSGRAHERRSGRGDVIE